MQLRVDRTRALPGRAVAVLLAASAVACCGVVPALASARSYGGASAQRAKSCGHLGGHGLEVPLPIGASGVSCARARKLASAWGHRRGACAPIDGGAPHRSCVVQSWKCTAAQSLDGATVPVTCRRQRKRVKFKAPV